MKVDTLDTEVISIGIILTVIMIDTDTLVVAVGVVATEADGIRSTQLKYPLFRITMVTSPSPVNEMLSSALPPNANDAQVSNKGSKQL